MNLQGKQHNNLKFVCLKTPIEDFITKDDFNYYCKLKNTLSSHICRNCRNRRIEAFNEILSTIHYFVTRKKEDSWKRSLICGVCWYKNYIVVNIRQMSYLLDKCKSSINGSLQRLCLFVLQDKKQSLKIILEAIPYLKNQPDLIITWSVRQNMQMTPIAPPFVPINQFIMPNSVNYINKLPKTTNANKKYKKLVTNPVSNNTPTINTENRNDTPKKIEQNVENKISNNSSSGFFSDLFDESELPDGLYDKFNSF